MSRCMADRAMRREFPDPDQRAAVCMRQIPARKMPKPDEPEVTAGRSGGENEELSKDERAFAQGIASIFTAQYSAAIEREIVRTLDFDWVASETWADEIERVAQGHIGVFMGRAGRQASSDIGISITDFVDRPHVQQAIREEAFEFAQATGQETVDKLRDTLLRGHEKGESVDELTRRVSSVFGDAGDKRAVNWRAERIARTESSYATHMGDIMGWGETGVVEAKIWDASGDACPFCRGMHGKVADLKQPFFDKGDSFEVLFNEKTISMPFNYRAVQAPPLHPNCRCTLTPKLIEILGGEAA